MPYQSPQSSGSPWNPPPMPGLDFEAGRRRSAASNARRRAFRAQQAQKDAERMREIREGNLAVRRAKSMGPPAPRRRSAPPPVGGSSAPQQMGPLAPYQEMGPPAPSSQPLPTYLDYPDAQASPYRPSADKIGPPAPSPWEMPQGHWEQQGRMHAAQADDARRRLSALQASDASENSLIARTQAKARKASERVTQSMYDDARRNNLGPTTGESLSATKDAMGRTWDASWNTFKSMPWEGIGNGIQDVWDFVVGNPQKRR